MAWLVTVLPISFSSNPTSLNFRRIEYWIYNEGNVKADYIHYQWLERTKQRNQDVVIERVKRPHQEEDTEQLSAVHDLVSCVAEQFVNCGIPNRYKKGFGKGIAEDDSKRKPRIEK